MAHAAMVKDKTALHAHDRYEYRTYLALTYPQFLAAAVVGRLFRKTRAPHAGSRRTSIFQEAMDAAQSAIPWVFVTRG